MHYVYILESIADSGRYYVGSTTDLDRAPLFGHGVVEPPDLRVGGGEGGAPTWASNRPCRRHQPMARHAPAPAHQAGQLRPMRRDMGW